MRRFYLPPEKCNGTDLVLEDREAHHGLHVLRLRAGERVGVLDGVGRVFTCEVGKISRSSVQLGIIETRIVQPWPWQITLIQAVPRGKIIESIIQKATELGAVRIVPLLSSRVVTNLDHESTESKTIRWRQVALEALKQSGSPWLPRIDPPVLIQDFLKSPPPAELALVGSLQPGSRHPRGYFREFYTRSQRMPASVSVWVGPGGDFSDEEIGHIQGTGALPITLGPLVLRSETAAVYCLSVLSYEFQSPDLIPTASARQ